MGSEAPKERQASDDPKLILNEVNEMKDRVTRIESFIKQAAALAAIETRRVDDIRQGLETTLATFEAQLKEKDESLLKKESDLKEKEATLTAKVSDLEGRLAEREKLLQTQDAELKDLKPKYEQSRAQLKEKEDLVQKKDTELKELEKTLTAEMRELEERVNKLLRK